MTLADRLPFKAWSWRDWYDYQLAQASQFCTVYEVIADAHLTIHNPIKDRDLEKRPPRNNICA